jgi:ribonuclease H2 subunit B
VSPVKADGTLGSFRPADDIFEEAATLLVKAVAKDKDISTTMSEKDILHFSSLQCARNALRRLCDVKGRSIIEMEIL